MKVKGPSHRMSLRSEQHKDSIYFLNLSRADFCPDSFIFFSSTLFRSSIFILSSTVFRITSCTEQQAQKDQKLIMAEIQIS